MAASRKTSSILALTVLISTLLFTACGNSSTGEGKSEEKIVNIMGWANYLPPKVVDKFKEETGIKINYSTITSNAELMAKLSVGNHGFDIAIAGADFVETLMKTDKLEKINKSNIPNVKYIGKDFSGFPFDPNGDYFVPAYWGGEIIAVNEKLVDKPITGYKDLFDPMFQNSLVAVDDPHVMLGIMLGILGYSPNSTSEKEIKEAGELLKKLAPNIKSYEASDADRLLASGEVKAGIVYNGKVPMARLENPAIKAVIPKEVLTLWQDNFVIPKGAEHIGNAEKFIDFLNRPEISRDITLEQPYPSANVEAMKLLPNNVRQAMEVIPPAEIKRGTYLTDVEEALQYYDRVWTEVKQ
ncbi:UNVERIFIED_CONTAM: spermidine/putrescine-binding protein [Brevibacillus sp. OAP136]